MEIAAFTIKIWKNNGPAFILEKNLRIFNLQNLQNFKKFTNTMIPVFVNYT